METSVFMIKVNIKIPFSVSTLCLGKNWIFLVKVWWVELGSTDSLSQILRLANFMDWQWPKLLNDLSSRSVLPKKKQEEFRINENIFIVDLFYWAYTIFGLFSYFWAFLNIFWNTCNAPLSDLSWKTETCRPEEIRGGASSIRR